MAKSISKNKKGRPEIKFNKEDLKTIETLGKIKAPYDLIANHFGCSTRTIANKMADEESDFFHAYKKGFAKARMALAKKQLEIALGGNVTMLIWLGKQWLEQTDKQEIDAGPVLKGTFADWLKAVNGKNEN